MKQQSTTERSGQWSGILLVAWFLLNHFSAHAQVSGYVFRDFNADGIRTNRNPIEPGVAGATVRVFVDIDPTPRTTTTRSDGTFSFDATAVPPGQPLRVEFKGFEAGYYTGPFGAGSGTTVQFLTSGASATAVYAGVNYPSDYCQSNPPVVTPCYVNGNPLINTDINGNIITDGTKKAGNGDVLVGIPYTATGLAGSNTDNTPDHLATGAEIGSVWAVAFQRRHTQVFSGATMKRHSGLGPLGTGGIYRTDVGDGSPTAGTSSPFIDVRTISIDTGPDTHTIGTGKKDEANRDAAVMAAVGRVAIGGIDFSEDDKSLFFINLNDRKIYNVFIDAPARTPTAADVKSWTIADPGCVQGVFRPWALKTYRGKIYVGGVCTGENVETSTTANPDQPDFALALANRDKLRGFVYRFDPQEGPTAQFEQVLSFPLSYTRGSVDIDCPNIKYWFPWTDKFPEACNPTGTLPKVSWPQPIISDLAFDDDGSLMIGLLDRFGFMAGNQNLSPVASDTKLYDGFTGGDLLRANRNDNGTYTLESNGTAGPYTNPAGVNDGKGPGGGTFFTDKFWLFYGIKAHDAILNGALNMVPGSGEVFSSAFDPYSDPNNEVFRSAGYKMLNPRTGLETRSFVLYWDKPGDKPAANGTFGKAAGLGDAQALCEVAPIEIGNRIWYDDNRNGIQEAYETGINNLTLTLHDMEDDGKTVATQVTRNGGQFYFNNKSVSPSEIFPDHLYQIRLTTDQLPTIDLYGNNGNASGKRGARAAANDRIYTISPYGQGDNMTNSKGVMDGDYIKIDVTTGDYGQNAHIYDLSVYSCPVLTVTRKTVQVCQGQRAPDVTMDGKYFARFDKVQFVEFDSPKSGTAMYGTGGRVLGEFTPASFTNSSAESFTLSGSTISTAGANKYVYALVSPAPTDPACRPYDETIIEIIPTPVVSATGAALTCSIKSVTLTSTATDSKGNSLTGVNYTWTGPNGYTANTQNAVATQVGTYTVSAATVQCPQTFGTAIVSVTAAPTGTVTILRATGGRKATANSSVTLTVSTMPVDADVLWNGPNNFTGNTRNAIVSVVGEYSLVCSSPLSCTPVRTRVFVDEPYPCPDITVSPTALTLCPGQVVPSLTASLSYAPGVPAATGDHVDFVYFAQMPTPTELASGGTLLQSITPGNNGLVTLTSTSAIQTSNPGNTPVYRYVYAIFRPGSSPSACTAVYASTVIQIAPNPEFSLTALSPTCSGKDANADGQVRMLNFDTNAGLKYILSTSPIAVPITAIPADVLATGLLRGGIVNPASATTYYVRVNSPAGCVTEKQVTLRPASCQCPTGDCLPVKATRIR